MSREGRPLRTEGTRQLLKGVRSGPLGLQQFIPAGGATVATVYFIGANGYSGVNPWGSCLQMAFVRLAVGSAGFISALRALFREHIKNDGSEQRTLCFKTFFAEILGVATVFYMVYYSGVDLVWVGYHNDDHKTTGIKSQMAQCGETGQDKKKADQ